MWDFLCLFVIGVGLSGVSSYITEPQLQDTSNGHTTVGEDINLKCTVTSEKPNISIEWNVPINLQLHADRVSFNTTDVVINSITHITSFYTVSKSRFEDTSIYYCRATDPDNVFHTKYAYIWVPVYNKSDHIIEFDKNQVLIDKTNTQVQVYAKAHPNTTFTWLDKNNKTIEPSFTKFTTLTSATNRFTNYKTVLKFNNMFEKDFGNYTVIAKNRYESKTLQVLVNLTGPPSTSFTVEKYSNNSLGFKCWSTAHPRPRITWTFQKCNGLSCFIKNSQTASSEISEISEYESEQNGLQTVSFILVNGSEMGIIKAIGANVFGNGSLVQHIYKAKNGFEIFAQNTIDGQHGTTIEALLHENVVIICAASLKDYHHEIKWYREGREMSLDDIRVPIKGFKQYYIKNFDAIYSSVSVVTFDVESIDERKYFCNASRRDGNIFSRVIKLTVKETSSITVATNLQNQTNLVKYGQSWKYYCNVGGSYPTPSIEWFKDNILLTNSTKTQITNQNQTLIIDNIDVNGNGTYSCQISNRLKEKQIKFAKLGAIEKDFDWLLVVIIVLAIVLSVIIVTMVIRIRRENKLKEELKLAGLVNFEKGDVDCINPALRVEEQADLLPYDKKWEIPIENLKLGKELGSGAFGVVMKAELSGFFTKESTTTVAVKTVNKFAGYECIRALVSELKIMVHLGKHVNIVNLIGACTSDIMKKKLLVVVEYCPFGNLQEYILYNTNRFIDQRRDDEFDWTICQKSSKKEKNDATLQYTTLSFSSDSSASSCKPLTRNSGDLKCMCSQDFLIWALQICKGMEYLASRNVLHGDLAARNVLLSENNVVKISDFGLARSMYKSGIYKKTEKGPLPVKWMAVESIGENIFSTQSDVWSFGVVLWEFFSLSKTPYPGMPVDQVFYNKLFSGYRMEAPYFATTQIYEIMLDCWKAIPIQRPSFTELAERIGVLLEATVKEHYLHMNGSYVFPSSDHSGESSPTDYLAMMSSPSIENTIPSSPNFTSNINYFHTYQNNMGYVSDKTDSNDLDNSSYKTAE